MDAKTKNLRLAAKKKLLSMGNQSSERSSTPSDLNERSLPTKTDITVSDDEKVNMLLTTKTSAERISSDHVIANIIKLISSNMPFGIPVSELTNAYNTNYIACPSLDVNQFGVASIDELLSLLANTEPIHCRPIDGVNRVFADCRSNVTFVDCDYTRGFVDKTLGFDFRDDIVYPGEYIADIRVPSDSRLGINNSVEVKVTCMKDPLNIWIRQFNNGYNCHEVLSQLLADLNFYNQIDLEKWRVPHQFLCVGLPVIAFDPCTKCWQRARIIEIHAFTVTVIFVDCGGMVTPSINNIYLMKRRFLTLTAQALHVGIYGVKHLIAEQIKWPVKLVVELRYLLYTNSEQCIRCSFAEKMSDNYYYVHLFDKNNICLDLDVFISDFFTDETFNKNRCPLLNLVSRIGLTSGGDNDGNKNKDNPQNYYKGTSLSYLETINAAENLLIPTPLPSPTNNFPKSAANLDQILLEPISCDEMRNLVAPLIPDKIHSPNSDCSPKTSDNAVIIDEARNTSPKSVIIKLKPNIKIRSHMEAEETTTGSINANLPPAASSVPDLVKRDLKTNQKLEPVLRNGMLKHDSPLVSGKLESLSVNGLMETTLKSAEICNSNQGLRKKSRSRLSKASVKLTPNIKITSNIGNGKRRVSNVVEFLI